MLACFSTKIRDVLLIKIALCIAQRRGGLDALGIFRFFLKRLRQFITVVLMTQDDRGVQMPVKHVVLPFHCSSRLQLLSF